MAELTQEVISFVESTKWDDDIRQEFYVDWLERESIPELPTPADMRSYVGTYLYNIAVNLRRKETNRKRIEHEFHEQIVRGIGLEGQEDDPREITEARQRILKEMNGLSAVLRETLVQYYVEGRSPEDIAETQNENVEAVRKRITRARNQLKGDS